VESVVLNLSLDDIICRRGSCNGAMFSNALLRYKHEWEEHKGELPLFAALTNWYDKSGITKTVRTQRYSVYTCKYCNAVFKNYATITEHLFSVHECGKYKCRYCNVLFTTGLHYYMHVRLGECVYVF
jgi:hypothetical protein